MSANEKSLQPVELTLPEYIDTFGDKLGVPKSLRDAIFTAETNTQHTKNGQVQVSNKGARGVGQLMPGTAKMLGVEDINDPIQNAHGALRLQKQLYDKYLQAQGDEHEAALLAAAAYNAGEGAVDKYGGIPPYKETQGYVSKVAAHLKKNPIKVPPAVGASAAISPAPPPALSVAQTPRKAPDVPVPGFRGDFNQPVAPVVAEKPPAQIDTALAATVQALGQKGAETKRRTAVQAKVEQARARMEQSAKRRLTDPVDPNAGGVAPGGAAGSRAYARAAHLAAGGGRGAGELRRAEAEDARRDSMAMGDFRKSEGILANVQRDVAAQQTPAERSNQRAPNARMFDVARTGEEEVLRRAAVGEADAAKARQDEQWHALHKEQIDNNVRSYRKAIKISGSGLHAGGANKWLAEMGAKGGAQLAEFVAGLPGSKEGDDLLKIHAEAMIKAAEAEGADRNAISKFTQDIAAGFIGTAPEMAAMSLGVPAAAAFGAGGGIRAKGRGESVVEGTGHGIATGAAFEIPVAGQGLAQVAKKAGAVGAATAGVELAAGAPLSDAIKTGATNALMVGVPGAVGGRRAKKTEADVTPQPEAIERPGVQEDVRPIREELPVEQLPDTQVRETSVIPEAQQVAEVIPSFVEEARRRQAERAAAIPERRGEHRVKDADWLDMTPDEKAQVRSQLEMEMGPPTHENGKLIPQRGLEALTLERTAPDAAVREVNPSISEVVSDVRGVGNAQSVSGLPESKPLPQEFSSASGVPSKAMFNRVLTALHDPKIRERIVEFIPVDVVNDLIAVKSSTDVLLHDLSVDANVPLSFKVKDKVSIRVDMGTAIEKAVADLIAKRPLAPAETRRHPPDVSPTLETGNELASARSSHKEIIPPLQVGRNTPKRLATEPATSESARRPTEALPVEGATTSTRRATTSSLPSEAVVEKLPNDILHLNVGHRTVDVFQNPTGSDYRELTRRFREEYPNAPKGEANSRFTKDAEGNIFVWASGDAIHADVDPALGRLLSREVSQNQPARAAWEAKRATTEPARREVIQPQEQIPIKEVSSESTEVGSRTKPSKIEIRDKGEGVGQPAPTPSARAAELARAREAFSLPLIEANARGLNKPIEITFESPDGRQVKKTISAKDRQKQLERKQSTLNKLLDCLHG